MHDRKDAVLNTTTPGWRGVRTAFTTYRSKRALRKLRPNKSLVTTSPRCCHVMRVGSQKKSVPSLTVLKTSRTARIPTTAERFLNL